MNKLCWWMVFLCLVLAGMPVRSATPQDDIGSVDLVGSPDRSSVVLFNGIDLQAFDFDPQYWRAVDGEIHGQIPPGETLDHNTWLVYRERSFDDFELSFRFKLSGAPAANSGVQFRAQVESFRHVSGYQADLDQGATWLGRIYDEHGRGLLVERGTRVEIDTQGQRRVQSLAPASMYGVLFRENDWNDYKICAIGPRVRIEINGTLFCELIDREEGQADLEGAVAWQLHSGPETLLQLKDMQLTPLDASDPRLGGWPMHHLEASAEAEAGALIGLAAKGADGRDLNFGFESGALTDWEATGDAFQGQPVRDDGISARWPDQASGKVGDFFIGGYEVVQDRGTGTLTSAEFVVSQPYASYLLGGGRDRSTRVELLRRLPSGAEEIWHVGTGQDREAMQRVVVDTRQMIGQTLRIRLVDENAGAWGHLNFDDFRFHAEAPEFAANVAAWRTTANPLLQHLQPNRPVEVAEDDAAAIPTLEKMYVPSGFSVHAVAAEPRVHQPMAFTFDRRGRLWVVEGHCYPERRPEGQGLDRILIFSDTDRDGRFETRQIFCEGLNLVSGLEVGHGGVWVGAAPNLLFIPDRDGDDRPDGPPAVLLDGFGYADTHETLNNFCWGPDGWLYGNQGVFNQSRVGRPGAADESRVFLAAGVFRYHPTRHIFEVFAHGGSNQWGLDFDQWGQCFITHCRSYWGGGPTTHVVPGGHYWNQVNSGYADFVSAQGLDVQPQLKHYLMASARYGHGEGGAGKPGSRSVYGGHSHVGAMIYLGDNWPAVYRNRLFTHNLHGHQMNQQVNVPELGGFRTVHAGEDMFFCADPQFIGVDLKVGPDGAVYFSDWYDPRHCHNPNIEQWERGNGRLYRLQYDSTYQAATVDLGAASDADLVALQDHANDWYARQARLELAWRASQREIEPEAVQTLRVALQTNPEATARLRALWCLHVIGSRTSEVEAWALRDSEPYVRGWAVRLAGEALPGPGTASIDANASAQPERGSPEFDASETGRRLWTLTQVEDAWYVKRELASVAQRLPGEWGWRLVETLAAQESLSQDSSLVSLVWFSLARLMKDDVARGLRLADQTPVLTLRDSCQWYAAKLSTEGRQHLLARLGATPDLSERYRHLRLLQHAVQSSPGLPMPSYWKLVAESLYDAPDGQIRQAAQVVGSVFRDPILMQRSWAVVDDPAAKPAAIRTALQVLALDTTTDRLPRLLELLEQPALAPSVLTVLRRYQDLAVADRLLVGLNSDWEPRLTALALELLTSRPEWASALLDAVEAGRLPAGTVTAFHVRQMHGLGDGPLTARLESTWGRVGGTSAERLDQIKQWVQIYEAAPLWAYDTGAGRQHFERLCASCHQDLPENARIAPQLAGSGSKGIAYLVENIVDPNAVVGRDFQATLVLTVQGRVVTGLVTEATEQALTVRTATGVETIARDDIEEIQVSEQSFMPEGLLQGLEEREAIELFKYLLTL